MKISVSSYSFSQQFRAGKMTQLDCVAKAKEMGFDAIEFTDIVGDNLSQQKEYAQKHQKIRQDRQYCFKVLCQQRSSEKIQNKGHGR